MGGGSCAEVISFGYRESVGNTSDVIKAKNI